MFGHPISCHLLSLAIEASSLQKQKGKNLYIFTLDRAPVVRQINVPQQKKGKKVDGTSTSGMTSWLLHYALYLLVYFLDGGQIPSFFMQWLKT